MRQKNYEKGITLIALVITIIVLLILAGTTLNIVMNDGLINNSKKAVDGYKISSYKENIEVIKTSEYFRKIADNLTESLKDLVVNQLENEKWVRTVESSEDSNQIKIITEDEYVIIAEIEEDGTITYITVDKDNGEPYPTLTVDVITSEDENNEKIEIKVVAEVQKLKNTKKISKIELIKNGVTLETRSYSSLKVEDTFEVEENGTYRIKATTDQNKSTTKNAVVNIQGIADEIQISATPTTSRNTENTGRQNGIEAGPITVTIVYGETDLQKQYKVGTEEWKTVSGTTATVSVTKNTVVVARYYDGTKGYGEVKYNVQNVDNVAPNEFSITTTNTTNSITVSANATDTASEGAASGTEGILRYEYKINNESWQTSKEFTNLTTGTYTIQVKAIDKAGNEKIATKSVTILPEYTVTLIAGTGIDSVTGGSTILEGETVTIRATISSGYRFGKWEITSGTGTIADSTSATTTLTATSNITITATASMTKPIASGDNTNGTENGTLFGGEYAYNNPVIPVGFKTSDEGGRWRDANNDGAIDGWDDGLVIEDEDGNQFVWVPCQIEGNGIEGVAEYKKWCTGGITYSSLSIQGDDLPYGSETNQIKTYGGFYIGRYEASKPDEGTVPQTKSDVTPWNLITYTDAKRYAQSYKTNLNVKSGLPTGTMWDTTLAWIALSIPNYPNSTAYGYSGGNPIKTGFTTQDCVKNIYDLAGNASEWTGEIYGGNPSSRVLRPVSGNIGSYVYAAYRDDEYVTYAGSKNGFRLVLYVFDN